MKQKLSKNKYLYKKLEFEEIIKNPQYFFDLWANSNLVKLLTKIFSNRETFIKLFDFRIIGSLILRDLRSSKSNKNSILNGFMLFILPIFIYHLNNKTIIEKKYLNLIKIIYGNANYYECKETILEESFKFSKKNFYIFPHHSFSFSKEKSNLLNLEKTKKKYSIIERNLKKKLCVIPVYDQIYSWGSQWWKFWIVEQILPGWKIPLNSINKIDALLREKNIEDLKHFFEFYIDNVICQNYDWEYKFNFIFFNNSEKKIGLESKEYIKILKDTLFLQILSAFCEKLVFEIEDPFKPENSNSIIELNNTDKYFSYIPLFYEKKITSEFPYYLKKEIFQNLKNWGESDQIIAKSYVFMKKKRWFFFQNYAEFYRWQLYKYKNYFFDYEKDLSQLNILRNKLNLSLFQLNYSNNEQYFIKVEENLSNISYQFSKYILYKIKKFNKLKKNYNKSINNHKIISQNFKYTEKKNKIKTTFTLNSIKLNFFQSNKNIFESLFHKKDSRSKNIKQLITNSIIWDIPFLIRNERQIIESNLFSNFFFKNSSIFWVKKIFIEDKKYIMNKLFLKQKKFEINNFSKYIRHAFLNLLSIDELNTGFYATKKYIKNSQVTKKSQQNIFFRYCIKSDNNRLMDLWKTKKNFQNLSFNSVISLDYAYKIVQRNKYDINKSKSIILRHSKIDWNIFYSIWSNFDKYNKKYVFQFQNSIKLVKILDQLNLLITKSNLIYNKTINNNINYQFQKNYELKKNLLFNQKFNKKNEIKNKILFILLESTNTTNKNPLFLHQIKKKLLIQNYSKKKIKIYNFFPKFHIKFTNWYRLNYDKFSKSLNNFLNKLHLINKFFFYLIKKNWIENGILRNIIKNIINKNLLDWKKKNKTCFYCNNIKKYIYINWNLNAYKWTNKTKKWKELSKHFVFQHRYLTISANKIIFFTNQNSNICWSKKLNKKNIYIFYRNFIIILLEKFNKNFHKISNLLIFYPNFVIIQNSLSKKFILNNHDLLQKIKLDIHNKLIVQLYFNKILPITKFIIKYFNNKNNNQIYLELFNNTCFFTICQNQKIYFNSIKVYNKNSLNFYFYKANTLKFIDYLHYSDSNYKKRLPFYIEKKKNYNLIYRQLIKNLPIYKYKKKKNLFINQIIFFYEKSNINSIIESQVSNILLPKYLQKISDQKLVFSNNNLNKLLNSLIQMNLFFYEKKNSDFINVSIINQLALKQIINFKITNYYQSYLEKKNLDLYVKKILKSKNYFIQTQIFQNYVLSDFFLKIQNENNEMLNWINKLFINLNLEKNSMYIIPNKSINNININLSFYKKNENLLSFFSKKSTNLIQKNKINKIFFKTSSFFFKWNIFKKYIAWLFTSEWWKYLKNIVLDFFSEILLNINDQFNYTFYTILQDIQKNLYNLGTNLSFILKTQISGNFFGKWNLRLLKQINTQQKNKGFRWTHLRLINTWNSQYLTTISLFTFGYFIFQKYFCTLLGSDYIELWEYFEIIQHLTDPSRATYLDNLIHHNSIQFIKAENILMHFFKNLKHYIKNGKFYLFTKQKLNKLLVNNKSLDLSRRERKLLVQSLITKKTISEYGFNFISNYNSRNSNFGYEITKQQGFHYLQHLAENFQKSLINYPFHQFYLAEKWIFLSFWQKIISSQMLWQAKQANSLKLICYKKPVPLQLKSFSSKGILLIGPSETGRSYLIKNLAADSFIPLIKISINKLLYNKPDIITESWMNILMESLRRLSLILELAKKMSPCVIWIQNIHELNVNRSTQNVESDPTFLLGILLKYFQTDFTKKNIKGIVIIGSTNFPKKVDPALISPNRLDQLINVRMLNILQRQQEFPILLQSKHNKYFYLKNKRSCLNEFGYGTMGYNARDLATLVNEILLINLTQNQTIINIKTIRLAFYRQALGSTYIDNKINFSQNYGILFYKVGKAIIQNLFIKSSSINPLCIGNDLWKKKFYYLSKWYLEPSIVESTIKEFTILPHILGCLAGLAARDSWFILQNKPGNLISLDRYAENDFYLACGILESFLIEFPWLEISGKKKINRKLELTLQFQIRNPLHMIKKGLFSIVSKKFIHTENELSNKSFKQTTHYKEKLYQLTNNITWAPRILRLSFIRSNLFDWIKRPNQFKVAYNFQLSKKEEKKNFNNLQENSHFCRIVQNKTKEQLLYERILSRIRRRNVQELESQLENILLEEQFVIFGFSRLSTEYRMEYQLSDKPMLFIGGRFLWDPTGLLFQIRHFVFSRQDLFVDEEMLRRLYVTYGARREREKSRSSQKIKQFFLRRGYGRDSMTNLSINRWNQLPFLQKQNIETFKRIEEIGVQSKRPQVFTPVYLYQRWLIENPQEKWTRFELLDNQQRWLKANNLLFNDSFIYKTLLEIYQYLLKFFLSNKILLNEMTTMLLKNKWLFQNEIEQFITITNITK